MAWNLDDYETVEERLDKFWKKYPDGRIDTLLVSPPEANFFIFRTSLYRTFADPVPFSTGYAREVIEDRGILADSAAEVCETSSIGRSLANGGFAAKGKRPSREEMQKVTKGDSPIVVRPFVGEEKPVPNEPETIVWDDEPKAFKDDGDFIKTLERSLGAEPIKYGCEHGDRVFKSGESKTNGKPWAMWACIEKRKSDQCEPLWGKLSDGKWLFELKAVVHG